MSSFLAPSGADENSMADSNESNDKSMPLLFIQVQPQTSGSTPKPLRTAARKHVLRNKPREALEGRQPSSSKSERGDMQSQLSRFRLDGENQRGYTERTLKPLAARPTFSLNPPIGRLPNQIFFRGNMPIQDSLATYSRDPFNTFPIDSDDKVQYLFSFYVSDLDNKSLSRNPRRAFIPIVLGNAACFHVLMATLLQYQYFQGAEGGDCFWFHRGAAIIALNQELSGQDVQITDAMFLTVVMLLYVESRIPQLCSPTASLHITALVKFLELRKGILSIELYCMLLMVAIWCSIKPPLMRPPSIGPLQGRDLNFELKLPCNERMFTPLPEDVFDNLKLMVCLRAELDENDESRNCAYQDFVSQCLMSASTSLSTPPNANLTEANALRCIQLGQILFLYTLFPSMSLSGVYCQSIAAALRGCLEECWSESEDSVLFLPEVLCWLLVNGAITQQVPLLRVWYLKRVFEFTQQQNVQTFSQLEAILRKTVWKEEQFGSACRSMWMEMENLAENPLEDK